MLTKMQNTTSSTIQTPKQLTKQLLLNNNASTGSEVNVAIVGALGVGKSALTVKYITRRFISEYDPNLEGTYTKNEVIDQKDITVRIMDTCDKTGKDPERYLNWADVFLVLYSITSQSTFEVAQNYMDGISQHLRSASTMDTPMILVGNKLDMERYRQVSKKEGNLLASNYDSAFFEITAAEEYNCIERVFHEAIREVLREQERSMPLRPLYISEERNLIGTKNPRFPLLNNNNAMSLQEKNFRFKFFNRSKGLKAMFQST